MSNMIKAYSIRYKEEKKLIDVSERAEQLNRMFEGPNQAAGFISGLNAIALEEENSDPAALLFQNAGEGEVAGEGGAAGETAASVIPELTAQDIAALKAELTQKEREAVRLEVEQEYQAEAEQILSQAQQQANQLLEDARQKAMAEQQSLFEQAKKDGYASGINEIEQEKQRLSVEYAQKEQLLVRQMEQMQKDLEPKATKVVIGLISALTGVLLTQKTGIVSYLVTKALNEADRSNSFLIRVSGEDYEEIKGQSQSLRGLFEREVTLEVVQDALLKKGECMIETDYGILDCSLGTQLEGLFSDLRLMSLSAGEE